MPILRTFARAALVFIMGFVVMSGLMVIWGHTQQDGVIVFLTTNGESYSAFTVLDINTQLRRDKQLPYYYYGFNVPPLWMPNRMDVIFNAVDNQGNDGIYHGSLGEEQAVLVFVPEPGELVATASSPDGDTLAIALTNAAGSKLYIMDITGDNIRYVLDLAQGSPLLLSWSPDGRYLLTGTYTHVDQKLHLIDLSNPSLHFVAEGTNALWSPDSQRILYRQRAMIYIFTLQTETHMRLASDNQSSDAAWSPDGRRIIYSTENNELSIIATNGSSSLRQIPIPNLSAPSDFVWSPDGTRIAFLASETIGICSDFNLYVVGADGSNLRRLLDVDYADCFLDYSYRAISWW